MDYFIVGLFQGAVTVLCAWVWHVLAMRRRYGGGRPLPAWLTTAERPSRALRELVAKVARSAAKDAAEEIVQGWDTVPPGLQSAVRREIARMVAEAFAIHDGRRG